MLGVELKSPDMAEESSGVQLGSNSHSPPSKTQKSSASPPLSPSTSSRRRRRRCRRPSLFRSGGALLQRRNTTTCVSHRTTPDDDGSAAAPPGDVSGGAGGGGVSGQEEPSNTITQDTQAEDHDEEEEEELPFPGFLPKVFRCLSQTSIPRYWCLKIITWPYPFISVIPFISCYLVVYLLSVTDGVIRRVPLSQLGRDELFLILKFYSVIAVYSKNA